MHQMGMRRDLGKTVSDVHHGGTSVFYCIIQLFSWVGENEKTIGHITLQH